MTDFVPSRFGILVPRHKEFQLESPKPGVKGYVKWELIRGGKVIRDSGGFHENLITDKGLNLASAMSFETLTNVAAVGTGATAPAVTDTDLQSRLGTAVGSSGVVGSGLTAISPEYVYRQKQFRFLEGNANGNLTEFATFADGSTNFIFSRQLLKDITGTPTVITKTSLDQLWITYEFRIYPPVADIVTTVVISGVTYDITIRTIGVNATGLNQWDSWIIAGPVNPFAIQSGESNALVGRNADYGGFTENAHLLDTAYVNGNFYKETQKTFDLGESNFATGIGTFAVWDGSSGNGVVHALFQVAFTTTKIPKDATKKLILYFRRHWARYP